MNFVFAPAARMMQRLSLLPKFGLIALLFMVPLVLMMALWMRELNRSLDAARQERIAVRLIVEADDLAHLLQQSRARQHLARSTKAPLDQATAGLGERIEQAIGRIDTDLPPLALAEATAAWRDVAPAWSNLAKGLSTMPPRASYAAHSALITLLAKFSALLADRSGLAHDPQPEAARLADALASALPALAEQLADIAGRGAAYIDTGLMEPNEDVLINSTAMLARRDLERLPSQIDAAAGTLQSDRAALATALGFLERTRSEVQNASNEATGRGFLQAGLQAADALHGWSRQAADAAQALLADRIERDERRRNGMVGGVLLVWLAAAYLLLAFYRSFASDVAALERAVARSAAGDLSVEIRAGGRDEIARLQNGFGKMNAGLAGLVLDVRAASDTIAGASGKLARGNAELATRTEAQAESLQQTAHAMQQLAHAVKHNADHAQDGNRMAQAAAELAGDGGHAVSQAVATMDAISASTARIGDIISVVDGIAFQTNILALNAAVEAARAGEAGRGFAVVAAEVRTLAQRSAAAAKEIKALIVESNARVEAGNRQVAQAGRTMDDVVASVRRVSAVIGAITAASVEQRDGIEHVNQAVLQMDRINQQNAVLVDQAALAAASLRDESAALSSAVAAFRLAGDGAEAGVERFGAMPDPAGAANGAQPSLPAAAGVDRAMVPRIGGRRAMPAVGADCIEPDRQRAA